ncbi:MAG: hypothetical protein ACLRZH_14910 [Ruthenibacterium lactatiformans]
MTVTGKDSGLLIGLSAKVEIILSQVTDVYAVPYDAVGTDENGGSVVYARSGGETEFTAIPVETGMETDYYIEISGEGLSDGMEVKTSANDGHGRAGADDAQQSGENAMFSMDMGGACRAAICPVAAACQRRPGRDVIWMLPSSTCTASSSGSPSARARNWRCCTALT